MKDWIIELFKDERGVASIKPVAAAICTVFLCVTMTITSFAKDMKPADTLVDAVMFIALVGMGSDTFDKFSTRNLPKKEETKQPDI